MRAELFKVILDNGIGSRIGMPLSLQIVKLDQQTLLQVSRADADRLKRLQPLEHLLDALRRGAQHAGRLRDRALQEAVVVKIADQVLGDALLFRAGEQLCE